MLELQNKELCILWKLYRCYIMCQFLLFRHVVWPFIFTLD